MTTPKPLQNGPSRPVVASDGPTPRNYWSKCPKCGYSAKPRTVGQGSQNHRANGFIAQIAKETGNSFDVVKMYCKVQAIDRGYPFDTIRGTVVPWSESRLDTRQAGMLIDAIEQLAAEEGIRLQE